MIRYPELVLRFILILVCVSGLLFANSRAERAFSIVRPPAEKDVVEETLYDLQAPRERIPSLNGWIRSASDVTGLDPILLACLLHTESRFKKEAVSKKGYKGEAQTERFSQFTSVNILEGAEILRTKLSLSNGDTFEALARYKGGKHKREAQQQAREVLRLYQIQLERRGLWKQG